MPTRLLRAEPAELNVSSYYTSMSGNGSVQFPNGPQRNGYFQNISMASARSAQGLRVSGSLLQMKADYSNYSIQTVDGKESFLSQQFNKGETSGSVTLDFIKNNFGFNITHYRSLSETPFDFKWTKAIQSYYFNNQLTQAYIAYGVGHNQQPLSYFTDLSTAQRKARPQAIDVTGFFIGIDHVFTERWRGFLQIESNQKTDRPRSLGATAQTAYSLSSRDFLRGEISHFFENTSDPLIDERGYFQLSSAELTYSRYITYDLVMNVGYELLVERETNPQNSRKDQLATDIFSFGLNYQGARWTGGLRLQQQASNVRYKATIMGAQVAWAL